MEDATIELWLLLGVIAGAFVLATLSVIARRISQDSAVRHLRTEVLRLRDEYAQRSGEAQLVEAEQARIDAMLEEETAKAA